MEFDIALHGVHVDTHSFAYLRLQDCKENCLLNDCCFSLKLPMKKASRLAAMPEKTFLCAIQTKHPSRLYTEIPMPPRGMQENKIIR